MQKASGPTIQISESNYLVVNNYCQMNCIERGAVLVTLVPESPTPGLVLLSWLGKVVNQVVDSLNGQRKHRKAGEGLLGVRVACNLH